jgi:TRAP-type C4-dicarboxylate transport system permease large subunit
MVPIALSFGYDKLWFGMIAIVAVELGLLTPPFGMVVFAMKAALPDDVRIEEIFLGAAPFFIVLVLALGLVIAFPQISHFVPRLLLG